MFNIALYEPRIAPNTGNIMRLVTNNGCHLHLIGKLGFDLEEKKLKRAGLDYRDLNNVHCYSAYSDFKKKNHNHRILACTTRAERPYDKIDYKKGDVLLFGSETQGLPTKIMDSIILEHRLRIPMKPGNRSLNLANAVAIISYEAWRQQGFPGAV